MNNVSKVVFAHDHNFVKYKHDYFTKASLNNDVLSIYKSFGSELKVICRATEVNELNNNWSQASGDGIEFSPMPNVRCLKGVFDIRKVYHNIQEELCGVDLVIIKLPSTIGLLVWFAAKKRGIPTIVEVIGNSFEANMLHGSLLSKFIAPIENTITKRVILNSDYVIYITKKYLQKLYPTKGLQVVCPNAYVSPVANLNGNKKNKKLILIGSLDVNYKGHEIALEILSILNSKDSGWHLYFVGNGLQDKWLKKAEQLGVENNLTFKGPLKTGVELFSFIDEVSYMLQPSKVEAQGRCIIEGMSRGKVVLASNVGGIPELLDDDQVFSPNDIQSFAKRILQIESSDDLYMSITKAQMNVLKEFNQAQILRRRKDFIHMAVSGEK